MPVRADRIVHVNSNCSDLARSLEFYSGLVGLRPVTHAAPHAPQPGSTFGLDVAHFDAWMLQGDAGFAGVSLDLLEWITPSPSGRPPQTFTEIGLHHLVINVPDLPGLLERILAAGHRVIGGPVPVETDDGPSRATAMIADPDGTPVQLLEGPDTRISAVVVNTASLDTSVAYYREVMGLEVGRVAGDRRIDPQLFGADRPIACREASLRDPASAFVVDLVEWVDPLPQPVPVRRAHDLGLFRLAWTTPDCAGDEALIRAAGSDPLAPTGRVSVGEHLPPLDVLLWPGPNGECLELIEVVSPDSEVR